eukprot:2054866-Amphidinium_carterae.1
MTLQHARVIQGVKLLSTIDTAGNDRFHQISEEIPETSEKSSTRAETEAGSPVYRNFCRMSKILNQKASERVKGRNEEMTQREASTT